MQPLSRAHLPLRALQLPDSNRGCGTGRCDRDVARRFVETEIVTSEHEGIRMKLNELASKLGLELRGDGSAEIFAPAPVEAAGLGMIIFVAGEKYAAALQSNVSAAITTVELAARAKCAILISANPYADFARAMNIFFPPYRPAAGIDRPAVTASDARLGENPPIAAHPVIAPAVCIVPAPSIHPHATTP